MRSLITFLIVFSVIIVAPVFASSSLSLASNLNFGNIDWGETITKQLKITNNGTEPINVNLGSSIDTSYYSIDFETISFSLAQGEEKNIDVELTLKKEAQYNEGGNKSVGTINVQTNASLSYSVAMSAFALSRLQISSLDVKVGSSTDSDVEDGETIGKKAKPGDTVEFSVELENHFDKTDNDYDIEDVNIQITINGIDDGDDLDDETDDFTVDAGTKTTESLSFTIPDMVKSDSYTVDIEVQGKNVKNTSNKYSFSWKVKLEVEKKKHDVTITNAELIPPSIKCDSLKTQLSIALFNKGDSDEDQVVLEIKNSDLNLNDQISGISLGKDYDSEARYNDNIIIELENEFAVPGTYPLTVNLYYDTDKLDDQKTLNLEIKPCQEEQPVVEQQPIIEENIQNETEASQDETIPVLEKKNEEKAQTIFSLRMPDVRIGFLDKNSKYYLPILVFFALAVLIFIFVFSVILLKR